MWQQETQQEIGDEPDALRGMSKSKMYDMEARDYLLPSKESRCISKAYLIEVFRGTVFRVRNQEILAFEVNLTLEERMKASHFNLGVIKDKAAALLQMLGHQPFGFHGSNNPDEEWLSRVVRFIDPQNLLRGFRRRVANAPRPAILPMRM